jgi:hypothetical protein
MARQTGIQKTLGNFESLIAYCRSYDEKYNPGNPRLTTDSLQQTLQNVKALVEVEIGLKNALQDNINSRINEFDGIGRLSGRIINAMASFGISAAKIDDANAHHRKLNGRRAGKINENAEMGTNDPENSSRRHSVSQLGFDDKISHFKKLIVNLRSEPLYTPKETELALSTLDDKLLAMHNANLNLKAMESSWSQSLIERNEAFNNEENGLVHIAGLVKSYVKSVFLLHSPQYRHLSALEFNKVK